MRIGRTAALPLAFLAAVGAQAAPPAPNPLLTATERGIDDAAHRRPLALDRLKVAVVLRGGISETAVTAVLANDGRDTLEGRFRFQLPAGAIVTGYALDVNGQMIDGVLVDRPRAKAVYEERVRQRVDPGLGEVAADDVFATRIFPIAPGATRTVLLRFTAPVPNSGYALPLALPARQGWQVTIDTAGTDEATITLPDGTTQAVKRAVPWSLSGTRGAIGVLSVSPTTARAVLRSRHRTGEDYLQLTGLAQRLPAPPRVARVYWDRSRARLNGRLSDEVKATLALVDDAPLELVFYNSSGTQRVRVSGRQELQAALQGVRYRGARGLPQIDREARVGRCLLVAAGPALLGRPATFAPPCQLDAVSSASGANAAALRQLAAANGGALLPLGSTVTAPTSASVVAVVDRDGARLPFIALPATPGRYRVAAVAPAGGDVTVRLSDGSSQTVALPPPADERFDGEGALLAAEQLAALGDDSARTRYVAVSRRYGVASPSLSFLVLETPQDYVRAEVPPPPSYPSDLANSYALLVKQAAAMRDAMRQTQLEELVTRWAEQVAWWNTRFDPKPPIKPRSQGAPQPPRDVPALPPAIGAPSLPPPPPPPPAPAPIAAREQVDGNAGNIVVTGARRPSGALSSVQPTTEAPAQDAVTRTIQVEPWQPERPYLKALDAAPADFDVRYREQELRFGSSPAFYLDVSNWLWRRGQRLEAAEVLLGALETPSANEATLGLVAARLEGWGLLTPAIELRVRHLALDPQRAQVKRWLALTLARRGKTGGATARADLQRAVDLLAEVALTPEDPRWAGIDLIALDEANALIPRLRALGGSATLDSRLIKLLDVDLRVVLDWSTDATDLDLWVDEPSGERAIYSHQRTASGGKLSWDMTQGFGPEEYMLRRAPRGGYTVRTNVFRPDQLDPNGASVISVTLIRDFGRPGEKSKTVDVELVTEEVGGDKGKYIGAIVIP